MSDHMPVNFCYERYRESVVGAKGLYYKLLSMVADLKRLKCSDRHISYCCEIAIRFVPYCEIQVHELFGTLFLVAHLVSSD